MSLISRDLYRFDDFELQPSRRTLLRGGEKVALAPKTFEVFVCLVSRAGEVVLKEELFKEVWPESFVEESNLTQHIFWIRKALADKAEYVVTIPGRGYQFTAPVRVVSEAEQAAESSPQPDLDIKFQQSTELTHIVMEETTVIAAPAPFARRDHWRLGLAIAASTLVVVGLAAWGTWHWMHRPIPGDHHEVVLADFENTTGDPDFEPALKTLLSMDLNDSPYLVVADEADTRKVLKLMGHSDNEELTPVIAREVCQRLNDQVVLRGLIARFGQKYLITLTATDCSDDKDLVRSKAVADNREGVLKAVDSVAADMRRRLGESLKSRPHSAQTLQPVHTFSLEALRVYSQALLLYSKGKRQDAIPLYRRAIELDPTFAAAYLDIGACYTSLDEQDLAHIAITKAYELRDQGDEFLRFRIIGAYTSLVTGDVDARLRNLIAWTQVYPKQAQPWMDLSRVQSTLGRADLAIEPGRQAVALAPNNAYSYTALCGALLAAGRLEEAKATCRQAVRRKIDYTVTHFFLFEIAFLQHDVPAVQEQMAWAKGTEAEDFWLMYSLFYEGKAHAGQTLYLQIIEQFRKQGLDERADRAVRMLLLREVRYGMTNDVERQMPTIDPHRYPRDVLISNALLGRVGAAQMGLKLITSSADSDTIDKNYHDRIAMAEIALARHQPEQAITELEIARPYDFVNLDGMSARARAYLVARKPELAESEFRKVIDHPFVSPTSILIPLAHLGLARAYEMEGNHAASRQEYQTLFEIWKNADADLPVLIQARREYVHLPK